MRIAIINITGGGMSGGYRKYLRNVIPIIAAHPAVEALLCASPLSLNVKDWFESLSNVEFVNCKPIRFMRYNLDQELKQHLEKFSPDVIYLPTERSFRFNKVPVVNMIQNMEPFVSISSNPLNERFRNWIRRMDGKKALKKSNRVIALSKYVRDFLVQSLNIHSHKIGLVYPGVELSKGDICRPNVIPEGWDNRLLFTAGSIRPARGLEDIIYALEYLSDSAISGLVVAGEVVPQMIKYQKRLKHWLQRHNLSSRVCWTGNLNEKEMAWCYQNCYAFVMTSRVEACPNIALEAMTHGCMCISSNSSCLPEIFDNAAVFYSLKRPRILVKQIQKVLSWPEEKRQEMRQRALKRASQFSWDRCVEQVVEELRKAIDDFKKASELEGEKT